MGLLSRLLGRDRAEVRSFKDEYLAKVGASAVTLVGQSDAGVMVTEHNAMCASAVWACVQIIANAVSSLPLHVMNRRDGGKNYDHPVYNLLAGEPNEFMTAVTFREAMMANLLTNGNAYAVIEKDDVGRPVALYPVRACQTVPRRVNGVMFYETQVGNERFTLRPDQMFHVLGLTLDGITGLNPIAYARQTVGLSLAVEKFAAKFFGNGGNLGGILTTPPLSEPALENFVKSWKAKYAGPENSLKTAILPDGYKYQVTGSEPEKAQMLGTRVHQVREIARLYRCPLHLLGDTEKASYASLEIQSSEFNTNTIQPWVTKWEAEANRKLFLEVEKPTLELRFNLDATLRATTKERYDAYAVAITNGIMTRAEARAKEGLPEIAGADVLLQPLNMAPVGKTPDPEPAARPARSLIEDVAKRVLTKEGKALARAAKKHAGKPAELRQWADQWYTTHANLVARTFAPALSAAGITTPAADYARDHCAASVRAITIGIEAGADAQDIADDFTDIRPAEIADHLLKGNQQ